MNTRQLPRFSIGIGDRFAHQACAQLRACLLLREAGVEVTPVWNKSNREHMIIGSDPRDTRTAADEAVKDLQWSGEYFLDADHVNLDTFERFLEPCDFFTIDVADQIGEKFDMNEVQQFVERHPELIGEVRIPSIDAPFVIERSFLEATAKHFLAAAQRAGAIYRAIVEKKDVGTFIVEVSMDETDLPQTPPQLLIILAAIADEKVPIQTIAPKFSGRFNKGVDYEGDVKQFRKEFRDDIATVQFAIQRYGLPASLKLSVHSGSDKYSIYEPIREALADFDAGVHLKTAGTTWLEEVIGLAEAGGDGLALAKEIYADAFAYADELCAPYSSVISIDKSRLPKPEDVSHWTSVHFVNTLRHEGNLPEYNPNFRQLLHVGFKIAAKLGERYTEALKANEPVIGRNVTKNLYERHLRPLFINSATSA